MKHNIFVNYYTDKNSKRSEELNFCILENIKNDSIDNVVVICNEQDYFKLKSLLSKYDNVLVNQNGFRVVKNEFSNKIIPVVTHVRPTFNDYFRLISKLFPSEENINIVSNLDIIIPKETLHNENGKVAKDYLSKNRCLALCRWDARSFDYKNDSEFYNHVDSQDCWFFLGKVNEIPGANYSLGTAGCDNGIAYKLSEAGFELLSPAKTLKTYHVHITDVRNYTSLVDGTDIFRIPPPYKVLEPTI